MDYYMYSLYQSVCSFQAGEIICFIGKNFYNTFVLILYENQKISAQSGKPQI